MRSRLRIMLRSSIGSVSRMSIRSPPSKGNGIGDLLDAILERISLPEARELQTDEIKLAIMVGPNVGKSSLVNKLLGQERGDRDPDSGHYSRRHRHRIGL